MTLRIDRSEIGSHRLDQNGYLNVDAFATRAGIFVYRNKDGSVTRELRHPNEVFKADSLETLKHRPISNNHPQSGSLTAKNTKYLIVGWNKEKADRAEGDHVQVSLIITDESAINSITKGEKSELSCGYRCDTYAEEGTYNGERYDYVQKNIKYNHIALVPKGRAGPKARIYLDADDAVSEDIDFEVGDNQLNLPIDKTKRTDRTQETSTMTIKIKRNAVKTGRFNLDAAAIEVSKEGEPEIRVAYEHLDSAVEVIKALESEVDKLQGKNDELEERATQAIAPERLDALTRERADLCGVADHVGVENYAKLDNAGIKKAIVQKSNPDCRMDEKSEDYIDGRYESVVDRIKQDDKGLESLATLRKVMTKDNINTDPTKTKLDEDEKTPRQKYLDSVHNLHEKTGAAA